MRQPLEAGMLLSLQPGRKGGVPYNHKELNSASNPEEQETDSLLETLERNAACRHLDFRLVTYEL